jgi:hypothetical protein
LLTRLDKLDKDKHSSLLQKLVNYGEKSFITLASGCMLEEAILYGSEPPEVATYWEQAKDKNWKVKKFQKCLYSGREKQVSMQCYKTFVLYTYEEAK